VNRVKPSQDASDLLQVQPPAAGRALRLRPSLLDQLFCSQRSYIREDKVLGSLDRLHELMAHTAN